MSDESSHTTSLSALTRRENDEPYIDPETIDWMDEFSLDAEDDIFDLIEQEILETDGLDDIGAADIISLLDAFMMDDIIRETHGDMIEQFEQIKATAIPSGKRKLELFDYRVNLNVFDGQEVTLYSKQGSCNVYLSIATQSVVVGFTSDKIVFSYIIVMQDFYKLANRYNEEVGGKGTRLGFSAFYHNAVLMSLAWGRKGVIEPHEGFDFACDGLFFEVTGDSAEKRETAADVVINKYQYNTAIMHIYPYHNLYTQWSWNEDKKIFTSFYQTGFDYEETKRSVIVKDLAEFLSYITKEQRVAIGQNYARYVGLQSPATAEELPINRDFSNTLVAVRECIIKGAKERNGQYFVPSPFRVLQPMEEKMFLLEAEIEYRQKLMVYTTDYGDSTYHTWPIDRDPEYILESKMQKQIEYYNRDVETIQDAFYMTATSYKTFTSAYIQANLLPKINGKGGCFYDRYVRVGITWYRTRANALTWTCAYYTFSNPGEEIEVGKWSFIESKGVYLGPNFKISRQDIHYASVLPAKFFALTSACRPLLSPTTYRQVEPRIFSLLGIMSNSSWMTTFRTGSHRFLTCCHLSESGDLPGLIEGQLGREKKHRFPDFYVLKRFEMFCLEQPSSNVTPLYRLPFVLASIEKDMSLMLQWHMRETDHDTRCMVKVSEAAHRHLDEYEQTNLWLERQRKALLDMFEKGMGPSEFDALMDSAPKFPTLNLFMFVGMVELVQEEMQSLGSTQNALGFSVWKMITDRHCTEYVNEGKNVILRTTKVVDAMSAYLRSLGGVTGGYELIAKMAVGPKLPPNYLLNHAKDAKESDREISQMFPQHRIKQNLPEVLVETFTGANDADQMSDPAKYSTHVEDTMDACNRGRATHASEDRSKFCQEQEPQLQALGLGALALSTNSTALVTAAAMTLMNKTRRIVYPPKADHKQLIGNLDTEIVAIETPKVREFTKCITIEKNMTQGLGAVTAGAINTVYVTSHARIIERLIPGIKCTSVRTTSDDVKRTCTIDKQLNYESAALNFNIVPNRMLNQCMMINNTKKFMSSGRLSEFNNVVATVTGMLPQSPVFATLCIQPLLSKSLFGDLVDIVNTSRSTLSWGCAPDTVEAALAGMLKTFRQKWLVNDEEFEVIINSGLIPQNMSEHISGFWIRNDNTLKIVFASMTEEQRRMILEGDVPLYKMLKRLEIDMGLRRKKKKIVHREIQGLHRANEVAKTIYAQRLVSESLISRHIQPMHPSKRIIAKRKFLQFITREVPDIDIQELQRLAPPKVMCHVRIARRVDRYPTTIGTTGLIPSLSLQRIRAKRFCNVYYRDFPNDNEEDLINAETDKYLKEIAHMERANHYQGLSFKAPAGRPLVRLFDGKFYKRPGTFDFSVDLNALPNVKQVFTYKGMRVEKFKPIIWGSGTLSKISDRRARIAFGLGYINDTQCIFYQLKRRGSKIAHVTVNPTKRGMHSVQHNGRTIYYLNAPDLSPLLSRHHQTEERAYMAGVVGDNDAIFNYGMYCRSNNNHGFVVYSDMFKNFGSIIPRFVQNLMPPYPNFPRIDTVINRGRVTVLNGHKSIMKLKMDVIEQPRDVVTINLTGDVPVVEEEIIEDDFFSDFDD